FAQDSASIKVAVAALELTAIGPIDGYICTTVPYEITVRNVGDSPARDVILTDVISGNFKIEKISDNGKAGRNNRIAWAIGTLNPGDSRTVSLVGSSTVEGQIGSEFSVSARCTDPKKAVHCLNLVGVPGVLTSLKDNCDPVIVNSEVIYTITASNTGTRDATNLRYAITLDDGMEFVSGGGVTAVTPGSGKMVNFSPLPVLAKGATATWTVKVKATSAGDKRFRADLLTDELDSIVSKSESTNFYEPNLAVVVAQ
ncbi:MAG: DUF11 domain-containing protein, partial [Planctomycetota bacterium]|nr:DUF11 domain-containing protein [Planctomycetota bacterium]